jgi:hypothetical protein
MMRRFSRWMPRASTPPDPVFEWALLALLFPAIWPFLLLTCVRNRRLRRLAAERAGEDIGTFARAFDRRAEPFDPWVIRATWHAFRPYVAFRGGCLPLRPTDRLGEDLGIDPDDVDPDLIQQVATWSGHSLDHTDGNPFYGKIVTLGDLVKFITLQPRAAGR